MKRNETKRTQNTIRERNVNLSRIPKAGSCLNARSWAHMATFRPNLFLPTTEDEMQSLNVSVVSASAESKRPRSSADGDRSSKRDRLLDGVRLRDHGQPPQQPSLAAGMSALAAPTPPATEYTPIHLPKSRRMSWSLR